MDIGSRMDKYIVVYLLQNTIQQRRMKKNYNDIYQYVSQT